MAVINIEVYNLDKNGQTFANSYKCNAICLYCAFIYYLDFHLKLDTFANMRKNDMQYRIGDNILKVTQQI